MNKVILMGRLTKDPTGDNAVKYNLAVDGYNDHTDYIPCTCFGKTGDFAKQYLRKGTKVAIEGRINTGSYEKDGQKVYTVDVIVDRHEFCEKKAEGSKTEEVVTIPDDIADALPFK